MAGTCTGPGPCDTSSFGEGKNWVNKVGGLPAYIRAVAHAFRRKGLSESEAIQRAVGVVKNWAEGKGGVTPATRARAAAAVAEWEAKKARSHSLTAVPGAVVDLAEGTHVYHWKHGWIPITPHAALQKAHGSHAGAARLLHKNGQHEDAHAMLRAGVAHHEALGHVKAAERYRQALATREPHPAPHTLTHGDHATVRGVDQYGAPMTFTGRVSGRPTPVIVREHRSSPGSPMLAVQMHNGSDTSGLDATARGTVYVPHSSANEAEHARMSAARNNAHVVARTRPTPSAADLTDAAAKWKRDNPGKMLAGHEAEVQRIADDLWRAKRLQGPDTGPTAAQAATERARVRAAVASPDTTVQRLLREKQAGQGIEITHTGDGTLVHGTSRNDGSGAVLKQHGFRWSSNLSAWYLPRNQHFSTRGTKVDNAERDLKAAGHDVTVTREAASTTSAAEREAAARARAADRADRMDTRSAKAAQEAESRRAASNRITDMIPMGQPILVGHHSEGRHRRDIARSHSHMEKSWEADRQAKESQAAADRARATAAGDSPLLRQRRIDRNNAEIRKIDKTLASHEIAVKKPEAAARFGIHPMSDQHLEQLRVARAELADQVAHDQSQIEASGHKTFTAADLKAGDLITYRGRTHVVKKVNKTTISVPTGYSWDDKVPINQITGHKKHADLPAEAQAKAKQIANLTAEPTTTVDLAADPVFATTDGPALTGPAHRYHHGWVRIDASAPTAVERATRAVTTDGHALLHGMGMVPTAQRVIERVKAAGHTPTVKRVEVDGKPHVHISRAGSTSLTAAPSETVDLAWTEQLHPRGGKGTAAGGKFVSKNAAPAPATGAANSLPANMAANVRDFQRRAGLPVTGVIDTVTAKKITAEATAKGGSGGSGKSKAKHAAAAARKQITQHVAAVNALSPGQRAQYRAKIPTPPTGYVWGKNDTLRRAPNSGALRGVLATIGAKSVSKTPAATRRTTGVGSGGQRTASSLTRRH